MILADTTVVIGFLRAPTPRLLQIIQGHQAAISGVTLAEVYAGARSPADFARFDTSGSGLIFPRRCIDSYSPYPPLPKPPSFIG